MKMSVYLLWLGPDLNQEMATGSDEFYFGFSGTLKLLNLYIKRAQSGSSGGEPSSEGL